MDVRRSNPLSAQRPVDRPDFRVHFWKGNSSDEWDLIGCQNVREALAWADENAGAERSYTLYAVIDTGELLTVVRLFGVDPNRHMGGQSPEWPGQVYEPK
jgi:hypothetical protein